jgi:BASS family bile acid:Na+ symporter
MRNSLTKLVTVLSFLLLAGFVIMLLTGNSRLSGMLLTLFFVFLALSFHGRSKLRKFAYTVWIFAAVSVSMNYPDFFRQVGDFDLKKLIIPLLQIIMFGMGSQLSAKNFADVIRMPRGVLVGIACQFTVMPVVGITVARIFNFPPEIAAGIILVGSSPSGLASNVMSYIAKANLALSVTLTAVATLLAPIMTPFLMKTLAGQYVPIDFWGMMQSIVNIVILPIVAGLTFNAIGYATASRRSVWIQVPVYLLIILARNFLVYKTSDIAAAEFLHSLVKDVILFTVIPVTAALVFRYYSKGGREWLDKIMSLVSMAGIGVIITIITAAGRDSLMAIGLALILACLLHNLAGYLLGYWSCRLLGMDEKSCRTIALEVGMQNGGLASGIALDMGKVATVGLAPAVFGPMMNITGSSLATWWREKKITRNNTQKSTAG